MTSSCKISFKSPWDPWVTNANISTIVDSTNDTSSSIHIGYCRTISQNEYAFKCRFHVHLQQLMTSWHSCHNSVMGYWKYVLSYTTMITLTSNEYVVCLSFWKLSSLFWYSQFNLVGFIPSCQRTQNPSVRGRWKFRDSFQYPRKRHSVRPHENIETREIRKINYIAVTFGWRLRKRTVKFQHNLEALNISFSPSILCEI